LHADAFCTTARYSKIRLPAEKIYQAFQISNLKGRSALREKRKKSPPQSL